MPTKVQPKQKWTRLKLYVEETVDESPPRHLQLSRNDKTGISLNVAMVGSCRPTRLCYQVCYGLNGPVSMVNAVKTYARNLQHLEILEHAPQVTVNFEADMVAHAVQAARQDFLRVNGVGDLVPGTVRLIEALSRRHPYLRLWVSTRKPELAVKLPAREPVHVMLSADRTTPAKSLTQMRECVAQGEGLRFLAYLQAGPDDVPPDDAVVVFAAHHGSSRAKWPPHPKTCGATIREGFEGHVPHVGHEGGGACAECRRCFDQERRRV